MSHWWLILPLTATIVGLAIVGATTFGAAAASGQGKKINQLSAWANIVWGSALAAVGLTWAWVIVS